MIANENELLMCSICHTPKEKVIYVLGVKKVVGCLCKCEAKAYELEQQRMEKEENLRQIEQMKCAGLQDKTFHNYTFEQCSSTQPNVGYAQHYVTSFQDMSALGRGLLFWGNVGTGKTFLAGCIANALLEQKIPVLMTSFPKLLNALGGLYTEEKNRYLNSINRYRLLIIDDFGVERESQYTLETIYTVIDERYKSGLPFIITTNIALSDFHAPKDVEHARIYDRILERCLPIHFSGKNFRQELGQCNRKQTISVLRGTANE